MSIVGSSVKPQGDADEVLRAMADLRAKREAEAARLREAPERSAAEIVEAVLVELNRQIHPLLELSKLGDLDDDDLDRMIRINAAVLAISRALKDSGEIDPSQASDEELRKAAKR